MMDALIAIREPDGAVSRADAGVRPYYSLSKTFIAAALMRLEVPLDQPVSRWFGPEWVPDGARITVRQLLTHSAGIRDYGQLPEYDQAIRSGRPPWSDEEFAEHTLKRPLLFVPGTGFSYSNPGYWLLNQIVVREAGRSFADAIHSLILAPLALTETEVADGVFADDLPDYPAGWVWHGLLVGSAIDATTFMSSELVRPLLADAVSVGGSHPGWLNPHYALGLMTEPGERHGHNGGGPGYTAACYHFEQSGRTICVLEKGRSTEEAAMQEVLRLEAGYSSSGSGAR